MNSFLFDCKVNNFIHHTKKYYMKLKIFLDSENLYFTFFEYYRYDISLKVDNRDSIYMNI